MEPAPFEFWPNFWWVVGIVGGIAFYGRFYVQWIVSEIQKKSVMPVVFWYMSTVGTLLLLPYSIWLQSPVAALSQTFNIVIYSRNLVHIWRSKGVLSSKANIALHVFVGAVVLIATGFMANTWLVEYKITQDVPADEARETWFWLAVGVAGTILFAARFLIQWIVTEKRKESTVPPVFWHLSLVAALLQGAAFLQRRDWVFVIGMAASILIYARNLWFIHRPPAGAALTTAKD